MHEPRSFKFYDFGHADPLASLDQSRQIKYLRGYLADLGATSALEEQNYFDRDYLSEFSAFYGISATGYSNICRRLHFFCADPITREELKLCASGEEAAIENLQSRYLGFIVIRPIPHAPLGRTVLQWYPEQTKATPRVTNPSRIYHCNLAGIRLSVKGLAWQQQDSGVGACATVGVWSILHSSAFDDNHAIPTTAEITRAAHDRAALGARAFPSDGMADYQIAEAIKAWNLSPAVVKGDLAEKGFTREQFAARCTAFIRSGYPVLLMGALGDSLHVVCMVGFRSVGNPPLKEDDIQFQDSWIRNVYIHDDNIGPNVKWAIEEAGLEKAVVLKRDEPEASDRRKALGFPQDQNNYPEFRPLAMLVAVHNDLRTSPDHLIIRSALKLSTALKTALDFVRENKEGVITSGRFIKLPQYLNEELKVVLGHNPQLLSKVRLELVEKVRPMSLHIGVIRIGDAKSVPIMDIFYDTTDSDSNHPVFANVAFCQLGRDAERLLIQAAKNLPVGVKDLGVGIDAF